MTKQKYKPLKNYQIKDENLFVKLVKGVIKNG